MDLPSTAISVLASSTNLDTNSASNNLIMSDNSDKILATTFGHRKLQQQKFMQPTNEHFTCLSYSVVNQTLCAGTNQGNLYTWKRRAGHFEVPEDSWQLTNISTVRGAAKQSIWGFNELAKPCMLINCISNVYVLKEQPLLSVHTRDLWAVQRNAKTIYLEHAIGKHSLIQADFAITALALNQLNLIVSNGRAISAYSIEKIQKPDDYKADTYGDESLTADSNDKDTSMNVKLMQTFNAECLGLHIQNQNLFCLTSNEVMIYSIGGVVLNKVLANDNEGKIIGMDLTGTYLSVFTMNGFIKTYDVSRHDPKLMFPGKSGYDLFDDFGEVILVKCNTAGTHLAVVIANRSFVPKPIIYCWNFERNQLMEHNLVSSTSVVSKKSCIPVNIFWDTDESRLLAIEVKSMQLNQEQKIPAKSNKSSIGTNSIESEVLVLFFSDRNKLNVLEARSLGSGEQMINLCVPNVITLDINMVKERNLQDFADLTKCDINTRKMVLNFSLHIAEGNMDLAYRCIRSIQSPTIWTNLAKMCVQTSRLDVAKVCMGHLGKARSVRALRQAMEDDDLEDEAKLAVLAIELGMHEKATELYKKCGRFDLLNKMLQARGKIDEAIRIAETDDRVHLKNTYFQKALELKEKGDIKGALEYFEKTQNPVQNITQMLLDNPLAMKRYMQNTTDPKMLKWWGQYIESSGDMDAALAVYQKAEDWFSQVKILCYLGKISKADAIARQSGDRAACYHLARHYENVGKFQEAIMFYTRAQTFSNAIRICKENDFQDELWTVASSSRNRDKAIAAAYFEECGSFKRAVELYHRAGMLHKALEMAFESEQPEVLEIIASELTIDSDAELVNRCADFFTSIEQHQKAVYLLAKTKHLKRSLEICTEKGIPITEELAQMLTPEKNALDEQERIWILTQLGDLLQQQGDYHTATKKFTQAGDKVRAMKSLLKSGSTEKIIFFANMSRQREVYIMAANYLQALNWQEDSQILKHIVTFYSKGQAYDSLANFYAICAQIEIDEYHDYEKALKAMHEAANCLKKLGHSQHALNNLERTIGEVKTILDTQNALKNGDNQMVIAACRNMLIKPETPPIRQADILAMLVRALAYSKQWAESGRALKELAMKDNAWSTLGLVDKPLVQRIAKECNLDFDIIWNSGRRRANLNDRENDVDGEEEIEEELR